MTNEASRAVAAQRSDSNENPKPLADLGLAVSFNDGISHADSYRCHDWFLTPLVSTAER